MTELLPSQILDRAGDLVNQPGAWHQGSWFDTGQLRALQGDYRCMCAEGALILASGGFTWYNSPAHDFLKQVIGTNSVIDWNDEDGRTQLEVVHAFRNAAELARGQNQ